MFLDPTQLESVAPSEILSEIAVGHLDVDHRVLRALLERPAETISALVEITKQGSWKESVDLEIDMAQFFHALQAPEGIPFLVEAAQSHADDIPDEISEALHFFGPPAMEALLAAYNEMDESESEELAFLLATFHIRD